MKRWTVAKLAELGAWRGGGTPSKAVSSYWNGEIPWVSPKDMKTEVVSDAEDHISVEAIEQSATSVVPANSLLMVTRSGILARTLPVARTSAQVALNQDLKALIPNEASSASFLLLAIRRYESEILDTCRKSGTTVASIEFSRLLEFEIPVPPLAEQTRIVAKIEELTARSRRAKEALDAVPPLLDRLRQSILAAAFRGDLTADWRAKNPDVEPADKLIRRIRAERRARWEAAELAKLTAKGKHPVDDRWRKKYREPEQVKADGLPPLANGWCWASVDEVSELQLGQQRAPVHTGAEVTLPYIRAANITWDGLDLSDVKRMGFPDPARYLLRDGDVVLSEASGSATEVGKPAIWRGEIPNCCYQKTLLRARPVSDGAGSEWLHLSFLADAILGRFAQMAPGVGILHLTADRMLSWPVPIAPLREQHEIVKLTSNALQQVARLSKVCSSTASAASKLDASILGKAFRGELVPQDPSDEPASVQLDRVRAARKSAVYHTKPGGEQHWQE